MPSDFIGSSVLLYIQALVFSHNPRLTPLCWDHSSVGTKPYVTGRAQYCTCGIISIKKWLYIASNCHKSTWAYIPRMRTIVYFCFSNFMSLQPSATSLQRSICLFADAKRQSCSTPRPVLSFRFNFNKLWNTNLLELWPATQGTIMCHTSCCSFQRKSMRRMKALCACKLEFVFFVFFSPLNSPFYKTCTTPLFPPNVQPADKNLLSTLKTLQCGNHPMDFIWQDGYAWMCPKKTGCGA